MFKEIDAYIQEYHWWIWQRKDVKRCVQKDGRRGGRLRMTTEIGDNICWALNTATLCFKSYNILHLDTDVISF